MVAAVVLLLASIGALIGARVVGQGNPRVATSPPARTSGRPLSSTTTTASPASSSPTSSSTVPGQTSPGGPAAAEAGQVNALLVQAVTDRSAAVGAVRGIQTCTGLTAALHTLTAVASSHGYLAGRAAGLDLSHLPQGGQLAQTLATAWRASRQADLAYAGWARSVSAAGCRHGHSPGSGRGHGDGHGHGAGHGGPPGHGSPAALTSGAAPASAQQANQASTRAKQAFVAIWNPLAATYHLPHRTPAQI